MKQTKASKFTELNKFSTEIVKQTIVFIDYNKHIKHIVFRLQNREFESIKFIGKSLKVI